MLGSPYPKGAYFVWLFSAPHTQPCRFVTSFSLLQKTLCTPLRLPGQALASHVQWKVRHTSSQSSPRDRSSDPVFKKKQSSEPTKFTVPLGRNGVGAPHPCYSGWFWVVPGPKSSQAIGIHGACHKDFATGANIYIEYTGAWHLLYVQ